jgi:PAS domain S-box-containing protein
MDNRLSNVKKENRSPQSKQNFSQVKSEFEQLAEASNDAIRIINKDFTIRYINHAFAEMTGVKQNDVIGRKCWEVFPSPLCHTSDCRLQRILNGERQIKIEIERQKYDDTTIPCIVTTSLLKDNAGNITGVVEQFRDITEIRHKDEEIKESEDRYRALIELGAEAGEAIAMLQDIDGKEGIQTFFNEQWPQITGYTQKDLLGTSFFEIVHPIDRQDSLDRHRQKMSGKTVPGIYEMNLIHKNGWEVPIELTGAFTTYRGKRANVLYIRDITSNKQTEHKIRESEELYRSLFLNVPIAIEESDYSQVKLWFDQLKDNGVVDISRYLLDTSNRLPNLREQIRTTRLNDQALRLWDVSNDDEYIDCFLPHNSKYIKAPGYRQCLVGLATGQTYFDYEEKIQTIKGNTKWVHVWVSVAPGCESSLSRVDICFVDMSKRKIAENELKLYQDNLRNIINERTSELTMVNKKLQEQMKQRIEFTRALAHELKTPLTPIFSTSDYMIANMKEEPWLTAAKNINRGAIRLNKRINELFDLTKFEMGNLTLRLAKENPLPILKEVVSDVSSMTDENGQHFVVDTPQSLPPITIDRERIYQVLLNLIENAIKFTDKGGKITLKARTSNNNFIVEVKNEGAEITPKTKERLFKPYYKCEDDRASLSGLGLGLALCKSLIDLHNGKIWMKRQQQTNENVFGFSIPL